MVVVVAEVVDKELNKVVEEVDNKLVKEHPLTKWLFRRFRLPLFFGLS